MIDGCGYGESAKGSKRLIPDGSQQWIYVDMPVVGCQLFQVNILSTICIIDKKGEGCNILYQCGYNRTEL